MTKTKTKNNNSFSSSWSRFPSWLKIIIGLVLGIIVGLMMGKEAVIFRPLGTVFLNSIMMMVAPVVFVSLVTGVVSIGDPAKMGRVASKSLLVYILTMAVGTTISLFMSTVIFNPGKGLSIDSLNIVDSQKLLSMQPTTQISIIDTLVSFIPNNAFVAFSEGNVLQIITVSIILGISIVLVGEKAEPVKTFFVSLSDVIYKLVEIIMSFAPFGVFSLMAVVAGTQGLDVLLSLLSLLGIIYLAMFVMLLVVYPLCIIFFARLNPIPFIKKIFEAQLVAFSTTSSAATLPINMKIAKNKLGIGHSIASFILPLGSTINMNGLSTYMGVIAVFSANAYGIELSYGDMMKIILTSTIAAIGCAGVPAAGLVVMPIVLGSVGIPLEIIGLLVAVNRIIDMISTATNITGDTLAAVLVAQSENELDSHTYNANEITDTSIAESIVSNRRFGSTIN